MAWDAVVALPFAFLVLVSVTETSGPAANTPLAVVMALLWTVPLLWRRTRPAEVAAVVAVGHLVQLALTSEALPGNVVVPLALYAVARYEARRRVARAFLVLALVGSLVAGWDWTFNAEWDPTPWLAYFVWTVASCALVAGSAWGFGLLARQRELSVRHLQERADALERERHQHTQLAAEEERTRIAREMHDVVAHSLSVIVVQADGAAYATRYGDPDAAAATAARALATIGETARDALADTRRLVAVLRGGADAPPYAPQAGVDDLDRLVAPLREAGRRVEVVVTGEPYPLPRAADLAVYRVVQESLTNVIKHAGPGAAVRVDLAYRSDAVTVSIVDDGPGLAPVDDGRGHGLIGMRERVAAYGGTLTAGPRPHRGFAVQATVPLTRAGIAAFGTPAVSGPMSPVPEPPQDVVRRADPSSATPHPPVAHR